MNMLISAAVVFAICFFAFKFNAMLGILVLVAMGAYLFYSNYAAYMAGRANAEFNKKNFDKAMALYEKAYKFGKFFEVIDSRMMYSSQQKRIIRRLQRLGGKNG